MADLGVDVLQPEFKRFAVGAGSDLEPVPDPREFGPERQRQQRRERRRDDRPVAVAREEGRRRGAPRVGAASRWPGVP
jgi:hypothetical protein